LLLVLWACAAVAVQAWLLSGSWPGFWLLALLCVIGAAAAAALDRRLVGAVLIFAYVFPLLIRIVHGRYHAYYGLLWMAALLGGLRGATGTMFDGNVCATIAAFWVAGAVWLGERNGTIKWPLVAVAMVVAWMAVWATASRTGFAVAVASTACVVLAAWKSA